MITSAAAQQLVLDRLAKSGEKFCIQSCDLSPKGDYWIVRANSEDFVLHGRTERCYVGVSAYLIHTATGALEILGSATGWPDHLQDKYDLAAAGDAQYVLVPSFGFDDKRAVIHLRQQLDCSLQTVRTMLAHDRAWLTGKLRVLNFAKKLLDEQGIRTTTGLRHGPVHAVPIDEALWCWELLRPALRRVSEIDQVGADPAAADVGSHR